MEELSIERLKGIMENLNGHNPYRILKGIMTEEGSAYVSQQHFAWTSDGDYVAIALDLITLPKAEEFKKAREKDAKWEKEHAISLEQVKQCINSLKPEARGIISFGKLTPEAEAWLKAEGWVSRFIDLHTAITRNEEDLPTQKEVFAMFKQQFVLQAMKKGANVTFIPYKSE